MTDLVEFLRARLDEDEQAAQRACEYASAEWHLDAEFGETVLWWPPEPDVAENERRHGIPVTADVWRGQTIESSGARIAPHIARHDPARVLREVEAKRRIISEYERYAAERRRAMGGWDSSEPSPIIVALAAVYADHPDYDPARNVTRERA